MTEDKSLALQWLPIETAPKDGREVLICGRNSRDEYYVAVALWDGQWMQFDPSADDYAVESYHHSHWMPLPEPPQ